MTNPRRDRPEAIEAFFQHGIHMPSRTLYIGAGNDDGEIDHHTAASVLKGLHLLELAGNDPVTVILNTPGGSVYDGLAIHDALKASQSVVTVRCYGSVMSMGVVILAGADHRVMASHATLMVHYGQDGYVGHSKDFERRAQESQRLNQLMETILLHRIREKHPEYTAAKLKRLLTYDSYMSAQTALDLGLIDEVLS